MIGHQFTTADGRVIFSPWECEFCQLNSAGTHACNCPNKPKEGFVPDEVEDYNDPTEFN